MKPKVIKTQTQYKATLARIEGDWAGINAAVFEDPLHRVAADGVAIHF
jgi:hypothetical protein